MNPGGPGWNDPPTLSYEIHSQTATRRNLLTKRVGLPDLKLPENAPTAAENTSAPPLKGSLPPPSTGKNEITKPQISAPPAGDQKCVNLKTGNTLCQAPTKLLNPLSSEAAFTDVGKEAETKDSSDDIETTGVDVVRDLKLITEQCTNTKIINKQVAGTILKKLDILGQQLEAAKLPETIQEKMEKLTACLLNKKYDAAWDIHVTLMCDHSSSVIQWMVGVKRLISEAKKLPN